MKSQILLICLLLLGGERLALAAEAPAPVVELKGIIDSDIPKALLGIRTTEAPQKRNLILGKGQREGEIEVIDIDAAKGNVTIRNSGQVVELGLLAKQAQRPAVTSPAEETVPVAQLKGILGIGSKEFAFLEVDSRPPWLKGNPSKTALPTFRSAALLEKGQSQENIELLEIDAPAGRVKIRHDGQMTELAFAADSSPGTLVTPSSTHSASNRAEEVSFLRLQRLGLDDVLGLYQLLTHRTLLRATSLPAAGPDLYTQGAVTVADVVKAVEQSLAAEGVVLQPAGEKFTVATRMEVPLEKINSQLSEARELAATIEQARKASAKIKSAEQASAVPDQEEILPAGVINFRNVDINEVLKIYGELTDRTLIQTFLFPASTVSLRTYTPLTREETIYTFTAVFALNGISVLSAGDKFLLITPAVQKGRMAEMLSAKGPLDYSSLTNIVPPGSVNIANGGPDIIAVLYGQLAGRNVELGSGVPSLRLGLRTQTAMTAGEALHALDLLLGLHRLRVQEDGARLELVALSQETAR